MAKNIVVRLRSKRVVRLPWGEKLIPHRPIFVDLDKFLKYRRDLNRLGIISTFQRHDSKNLSRYGISSDKKIKVMDILNAIDNALADSLTINEIITISTMIESGDFAKDNFAEFVSLPNVSSHKALDLYKRFGSVENMYKEAIEAAKSGNVLNIIPQRLLEEILKSNDVEISEKPEAPIPNDLNEIVDDTPENTPDEINPAEPVDPVEPVGVVDPVENVEPVEPVETIEPVEPVDSQDPIDTKEELKKLIDLPGVGESSAKKLLDAGFTADKIVELVNSDKMDEIKEIVGNLIAGRIYHGIMDK